MVKLQAFYTDLFFILRHWLIIVMRFETSAHRRLRDTKNQSETLPDKGNHGTAEEQV
jgi:hypothetical protein